MTVISRRAALALIAVSPCSAAEPDQSALQQRYAALKARYELLKQKGVDLSSLSPSIEALKTAVKARRSAEVGALLDRLDQMLGSLESVGAVASSRPAPAPSGSNLDMEFVDIIRTDASYMRLVTARAPRVAANGAVGRNITAYSDVAAQRDVIWLILRGLATNNRADVESTVHALEYAFENQTPQGNFKNAVGATAQAAVGADAFFLQAFGRVSLLIRNSTFRDLYAARLDALTPKLALAMRWLTANQAELTNQDKLATNRLFFDAVAFDANSRILNDPQLRMIGRSFAEAGLANQRTDGSFNEHNGSDSSYQAVSMLNIAGLIANATDDQHAFKPRLEQSLTQAAAWETTHIQTDGFVTVQGNSRTGLDQEQFMGKPKDVNYPEVALALLYASIVTANPALKTQGEAVITYLAAHLSQL